MDLNKYRPLIVRVLQQSSGKGLKAEDVASAIIQRIEDVELIAGSMGGSAIPSLEVPRLKNDFSDMEVRDIGQRIGAPERVDDGLVERRSQEELSAFAKNEMPSELQVKPPGFSEPFIIRKSIEVAPGGLGFIRLIYQQPEAPLTTMEGQKIGPTVQVSTTDKILDADTLTADIVRQAEGMYTKTPRVLTPKAPPINGRPGDLSNALSAEAPGSGEEGFTFGAARDMSSQWNSQRR